VEVDRAPRARAPPTNLPTRDLTSTYVAHLPWRASSLPSEYLHAGHLRFTSYVASNFPYTLEETTSWLRPLSQRSRRASRWPSFSPAHQPPFRLRLGSDRVSR